MNVTFVTTQICNVDSSFTVPNLHILVDLTTREQNEIIGWIEADRANDGLMTGQCHLKELVVTILLEIGANKQFDEPVIRACSDKALCT